uniref:C-type lectin domain-containing protein n=1 Tax=Xiphophorus couchianus TaxID=32473 RepID=A0A3B5LLD4_9TELE
MSSISLTRRNICQYSLLILMRFRTIFIFRLWILKKVFNSIAPSDSLLTVSLRQHSNIQENNKLSENNIVRDISGEISKLQASYDAAVQIRDEVKKQLAMEISEQQVIKWEHEHQTLKVKDYEKQVEMLQVDIASLKSHLPMISERLFNPYIQQNIMLPSFYLKTEEGCRHCLPGWTFMSSSCYYFPFSDTFYRTSWNEARQFLTINQDLSRQASQSGFWIGLRDVEEEGVWKWVDGTRLTEGFWNVGEPNNLNNEDCAAVYPKSNPFMSWNDAPCNYNLKWICEMAPRSFG